jgi:hypothetical protein
MFALPKRITQRKAHKRSQPGVSRCAGFRRIAGLVLALSSSLAGGAPLDAIVEKSNGESQHLATFWTKPTVLFYEDRDSTQLNQHVKEALIEKGRETGMLDKVSVVAVANVSQYNWFPARNFALKAVRDIEAKMKLPIFLDFTGSMALPPWNLPSKSSTVVIVNRQGEAVLTLKGKLKGEDVKLLLTTLSELVQQPSVKPAP